MIKGRGKDSPRLSATPLITVDTHSFHRRASGRRVDAAYELKTNDCSRVHCWMIGVSGLRRHALIWQSFYSVLMACDIHQRNTLL
jgi:hypothetical protein